MSRVFSACSTSSAFDTSAVIVPLGNRCRAGSATWSRLRATGRGGKGERAARRRAGQRPFAVLEHDLVDDEAEGHRLLAGVGDAAVARAARLHLDVGAEDAFDRRNVDADLRAVLVERDDGDRIGLQDVHDDERLAVGLHEVVLDDRIAGVQRARCHVVAGFERRHDRRGDAGVGELHLACALVGEIERRRGGAERGQRVAQNLQAEADFELVGLLAVDRRGGARRARLRRRHAALPDAAERAQPLRGVIDADDVERLDADARQLHDVVAELVEERDARIFFLGHG